VILGHAVISLGKHVYCDVLLPRDHAVSLGNIPA